MSIDTERQDWNDISVLDPYWGILSDPMRRFGRWDREAFLQTGREAIAALLRDSERFGLPRARQDALDFGCGVGRLTRALGEQFDRCLGLDISASMIEEACEVARGIGTCSFHVHAGSDLSLLDTCSFDLVLSLIVLQHIPASDGKVRYIEEFVRVVRPGGIVAFQLPSWIPVWHRLQPRPRLYGLLRAGGASPTTLYHRLRLHPIRMSFLPRSQVVNAINVAGGRLLDVREQRVAGGVISSDYLVTKDD